jgi:hypothetical protein
MKKDINNRLIIVISAILLALTYAPSSSFSQTKENIAQKIEKHMDVTH